MRPIMILLVLFLLFGHFGATRPPDEDVESLYGSLTAARRTNILFAGPARYPSLPLATGNIIGLLLLLLPVSICAKVRKKVANGSRCGIPFAQRKCLCITMHFEPHKCLLIKIVVPTSRRIVRFSSKVAVFADSLRALVKSRTAAVLQVSQDSLQRFWVFVSSTASFPVPGTCLQHFCKLATSPSASSMLRLLTALRWLLIVAGDVELNPGPTPQSIAQLLPTVDGSVLTEDNILDILEEVGGLAARWRNMCLALRVPDADTIGNKWRDDPKDCLREILKQWLKKCYNTQKHGPPTWRKLVEAVANDYGGDNPALAEIIAKKHQCTGLPAQPDQPTGTDLSVQSIGTDPHAPPTNAMTLYANYLRGKYKTAKSKFQSCEWPPSPIQKVLNLVMIRDKNVRYGSPEEMIRHTPHGRINDTVLRTKQSVKLQEIFKLDTTERKVILLEGAPGSGKSTLAWHICKQWQSGSLFQEFHTVVFVPLREPAIHSATSVEHILSATKRIQIEAVVGELQASRGHGMLWVLDGWDELPQQLHSDSIFHQLIEDPAELGLDSSTIVITSRPVASGSLYPSITSRIEILGFTAEEVKEYFTEALKDDLGSVNRLQNILSEHPIVEASCHTPLNAAIVTHLFLSHNHSLPTTLHGIFVLVVIGCLKRHMKKDGADSHISSLDILPSCLKEVFHKICTVAFHGVMKNQATFSAEELEQSGLPKELHTLGLIQGVESFVSLQKNISYNFLHLSVQELLASFYISKLPVQEEMQTFKELFGEPRFAAVFRFYAAFTKLKTAGIREIVGSIVKEKKKNKLVYLIHGLYEAQDVSLSQFVISQFSGHLDLSQNSLSPVDCLSLGYFLCCVCHTSEATFTVNLRWCSLDYNRIDFLIKEFSRSSSAMETADAEASSCAELELDLYGNDVGDEGAALLCGTLKENHSLKSLDLGESQIGLASVKAIVGLLQQNKTLEDLSLCENDIGDEGAALLCGALKKNHSLKSLDLGFSKIGLAGMKAIADLLQQNKSLEDLSLEGNAGGDEGAALLCGVLKANRSLKKLNLGDSQIGLAGVRAIADLLQRSKTLEDLSLWENAVSDEGAALLCGALKANRSLKKLNLEDNGIELAGMKSIANMLRQNKTLKDLDLRRNSVGDEGAALLCGALNVNCSLKKLNLAAINIGLAGVKCIAGLLRQNKTLEDLILYNNALGDIGVAELCTVLKLDNTLRTLNLWQNSITDDGAQAVGEALKVNHGLTALNLWQNQISDAGARALSEALMLNRSLAKLDLMHNQISDAGARALSEALMLNKSLANLVLYGNSISAGMEASLRKKFPGRVTFSFS